MSTFSGLASKGEKVKPKFQSLDINSIYRASRGEALETHQQKNTLPRKHGMQSLGKVPSARRAPANLPSLKSEHSGSDAAVSLVPSGGPGWGKQDSISTTTPTSPSPPATASTPVTNTSNATPTSVHAPTIPSTSVVPTASTPLVQPVTPPIQQQQQQPQQIQQQQQQQQQVPSVSPNTSSVAQPVATSDKSWSAVMAGTDLLGHHPPPYQSPQFQHEFPSLSAGDAATAGGNNSQRCTTEIQYGPGPSLRPQTEGSWIQGGSRTAAGGGAGVATAAAIVEPGQPASKVNSVQLAGPQPLLGQAGPQTAPGTVAAAAAAAAAGGIPIPQHIPPQFRGVVPPFMFRGNFPPPPANGGAPSNFSAMTNPLMGRGRFPTPTEQRLPQGRNGPPSSADVVDEVTPRPIIKEEDLNRMDDMTRDVGWASHDDIDYNQKLAFSDDDTAPTDRDARHHHHHQKRSEMDGKGDGSRVSQDVRSSLPPSSSANSAGAAQQPRGWNTSAVRSGGPTGQGTQAATTSQQTQRQVQNRAAAAEDEEVWNQRRRQHSEEVAIAVERAKLRKEEEEKRFMESKQAAAKKLQELEEKLKEKKGGEHKENDESQGTINPSSIPPMPITPAPIPVPDWERDKESRERSRTPNDIPTDKPQQQQQLQQQQQQQSQQNHRGEPDFRQLTQIEGRSFIGKSSVPQQQQQQQRSTEREISRERDRDVRDAPNFSRQFQSNLPPRFQKQQAERQSGPYHRSGNSSSPQPQQTSSTGSSSVPFAQQYDPRWIQSNTSSSFSGKNSNSLQRNNKNRSDDSASFDEDRNGREQRRDRHTPDETRHERDRTYSETNRKGSEQQRYYDEYRNYRRENSQEYEFNNKRGEQQQQRGDDEKWEKDRHYDDRKEEMMMIKKSQIQSDPFDAHDIHRQDSGEWHHRGDKYNTKEWEDRPDHHRHRDDLSHHRPDSRDSRISKESSSRDDYSGNWADSPFEPSFVEDKKKDSYRDEQRRQVPGPITKEKIEADDLRNEKRHLIQLKRSDNKDSKKDDKTEKKIIDDAWSIRKKDAERNESPKAWADATSPTASAPENSKFLDALEKGNKKSTSGDSLNKTDAKDSKKSDDKDKDDKHRTRDRNHGRGGGGQWSGGYAVYHGSSWSKRADSRTSSTRGSQRSVGSSHRSHSSRDWHATDSELSGDEVSVSTESGKEDRSARHTTQSSQQRSPKPTKKSDKDEKNKDLKQDKLPSSAAEQRKYEKRAYEQSRARESFVPRGEPSRHGRGGGFRGTRQITSSKRIDGYGIPPSKSPFGSHEDKEKKLSGDEIGGDVVSSDEKPKLQPSSVVSAGIIGSSRNQNKSDTRRDVRKDLSDKDKTRSNAGKPKLNKPHSSDAGEENWETTSDNSDTENERKNNNKKKLNSSSRNNQSSYSQPRSSQTNSLPNRNQSRQSLEKRGSYNNRDQQTSIRQNSNPNLRTQQPASKKDEKLDATTDKKDKDCNDTNSQDDQANSDDKTFDADGFQEVRSKKTVKDRQKSDEKITPRSSTTTSKLDKETTSSSSASARSSKPKGGNGATAQLTPQQIANIPPLLGTLVNPPTMMNTNNKLPFERPRQSKLPPRFAKQRENSRLQKAQMQQGLCDVNEMNKINQNVTMYNMKDGSAAPAPVPVVNAWDKPITSQLRSDQDLLTMSVENHTDLEQTQQQSSTSSQRSSPSNDKIGKTTIQDKSCLDGTTPPVNTIIFENTNYKSAPDLAVKSKFTSHLKTTQQQPPPPRPDNNKSRTKLDENDVDAATAAAAAAASVMSSFNKPISDILNNKGDAKSDPMQQIPLSFNKTEDNADMKLDFTFDSDLTQLTEDKSTKSLGLPRSMHAITSSQSTISPSTAELNLKIQSVKKVWEMPTVIEHSVVGQEDNVANSTTSFSTTFGPDPGTLDHSTAFSKGTDTPDDNHEVYSPSPSQSCTSNNTTNVCKVKPTQQLASGGQTVHSVNTHHTTSQQHPGAPGSTGQHSAMVGQSLIGHPLSPPPMQQVMGAGVGLGQPPQQYTSNQHMNYQPSLGGSAQYGSMSAIPSPPTVLFNSTQQMPQQGGLYGPFQIDQSQVMNSQGRSQYSQYPNPYGLGQTASSPYSAQSMYLQTAPPHPPPSAQPPPDMYQSLSSQYRLTAGPFGQSQQLTNNPSTVLISTTSNSLMSATVKPSSQQISAIGTKAGNVGQAYQQQSQQGQQLYIPYDPNLQANYLSSTGVLQRGPTGPVQNSVVPGLQPSSSFYSGSAGAQTGFYQQPGNSTMQSAPLHQHQTSFGLQGNVFGTHNQSHASAAGLQSFGSQFLSSPMQMAAAAALTAQQQFRSSSLPNPNYLKGVGSQHMTDQSGRSQQLKSPGANQQDVLASVFNPAPQIPSPKSRQNCKQPPPQSSPTQHKYVSAYQSVNNQQSAQIQPTRYPAPIQRPVNFQPTLNSSLQGSGNVSNRHRPNTHNQNSRGPQRPYYGGGQGGGITSSHLDKSDDSKLNENGPTSASSSSSSVTSAAAVAAALISNGGVVNKNGNGGTTSSLASSANQQTDLAKDSISNKDETVQKE